MEFKELIRRVFSYTKECTRVVMDPLPPYKWVEGRLEAKETRPSGYFILVGQQIVEVDWLTFEILSEGEALRVRSTRSNKAISIDRLVP